MVFKSNMVVSTSVGPHIGIMSEKSRPGPSIPIPIVDLVLV